MPYHLTCTLERGVFWRQVLDLSKQWCPHTELCKTRATWKQWTRKICFESKLTRNRWGTWGRCLWRNRRNYILIRAKSFKCPYMYKFPQYGWMEDYRKINEWQKDSYATPGLKKKKYEQEDTETTKVVSGHANWVGKGNEILRKKGKDHLRTSGFFDGHPLVTL